MVAEQVLKMVLQLLGGKRCAEASNPDIILLGAVLKVLNGISKGRVVVLQGLDALLQGILAVTLLRDHCLDLI